MEFFFSNFKDKQIDSCSSESVFGLLDEQIPTYKLRADTAYSQTNLDWIKAPFKFNEQEISELSNEQIQLTLDYFSKLRFVFKINDVLFNDKILFASKF